MVIGRSIRLFLVDGTPTGIITAEIMNWTGHVIIAPRSKLADFVQRQEAGRTGIYFLVGENPESALKPFVYVGETDSVGKRLAQHNKDDSKDFFDRFCVVTSKDQNLTKAHVRYLESRLIDITGKAGRSQMQNGTAPEFTLLPEADLSDMEFFIEQVRIILPVLGLDFLRENGRALLLERTSADALATDLTGTEEGMPPSDCQSMTSGEISRTFTERYRPSRDGTSSPVFELHDDKSGLVARAVEVDGQMVVLAGSQARKEELGSLSSTLRQRRRDYVASGILRPDESLSSLYSLSTDVAFNSPSQASDVILARSSNGRMEWVIPGPPRQTYATWQEAQVAAHEPLGGEE